MRVLRSREAGVRAVVAGIEALSDGPPRDATLHASRLLDGVCIARPWRVEVLCQQEYLFAITVEHIRKGGLFGGCLVTQARKQGVGNLESDFACVVVAPETNAVPRRIIAAAGVGKIQCHGGLP